MLMIRRVVAALAALLLLFGTGLAEGLTPTADWLPPDLSSLTDSDPEYLYVVAVAQGEVGYQAGKPYKNKYSMWYDHTNSPWCTEFVTWCVNTADETYGTSLLKNAYPYIGTARRSRIWFYDHARYIAVNGKNIEGEAMWLDGDDHYLQPYEYIPQPGDVMWINTNGNKVPNHTTLVEGVSIDEDGTVQVHVIEGNMEYSVRRHTYALTDPHVLGFGTPVVRAYTCLRYDSRYGGVNDLRKNLLALGYPATTKYTQRLDKKTRNALKAFQADHGLEQTATYTIETHNAMMQALSELP